MTHFLDIPELMWPNLNRDDLRPSTLKGDIT